MKHVIPNAIKPNASCVMGRVYAGDAKSKTLYVITVRGQATSRIGTLSNLSVSSLNSAGASFNLHLSQSSSLRDTEQRAQERIGDVVRIRPD
jgi:exosome complex RNA-binding protein Csl4